MKVLENQKTTIRGPGGKVLDYKKLIVDCLDNPQISPATGQSMGFTRAMLNDRNRIEKVLDDSGDQIRLEDSDATNLKNIVATMRWGSRHPDFLKFMDDVDSMETFKEAEPESADSK